MRIDLVEEGLTARIKVIGVGGAGGNAINNMIEAGLKNVNFIAANTDLQALESNEAPVKVQLGPNVTRGLGAGAKPEIGRQAALESVDHLKQVLEGSDMVFITAGMGGGTGTGAAPVVAQVSKELGALTVAVVTKPFKFEGKKRYEIAQSGIDQLKEVVDTIITIPNDRLFRAGQKTPTLIQAFKKADEVLYFAVKGIADLITIPGLVNVDFADVRTIMEEKGLALMGTGSARGEDRAAEAAQKAIRSPLLEDVSIKGAKGVLMNITASSDMTLEEVEAASSLIYEEAAEDANIIWGTVIDDNLGDEMMITVIATGINKDAYQKVQAGEIKAMAEVSSLKEFKAEKEKKEVKQPKQQKIFRLPLDEDDLDIPTFVRRRMD
ncbi:MAG: cell division protein FtsZ [Candidatus Desulfofervidaceae bacterium]|nr:cell division protein FtsZ [Candidatus Desulfofervidaceae bacterium]